MLSNRALARATSQGESRLASLSFGANYDSANIFAGLHDEQLLAAERYKLSYPVFQSNQLMFMSGAILALRQRQ